LLQPEATNLEGRHYLIRFVLASSVNLAAR
jgi:hypothetical protein